MSRGSRATQAKPEALVILFRETTETAIFMRVTAGLRPRARQDFRWKSFFARPEPDSAPARRPARNLPCAREQDYFGDRQKNRT
jgi:hypothetical protein